MAMLRSQFVPSPHRLGPPKMLPGPSEMLPKTEKTRRYFLEVQIQVPATKREMFTDEGGAFLEAFKKEQLSLVVSAWRTDVGPIQAVNYWDMGDDANSLLAVELALPDVTGFNAFNAIVQNEIKNIVIPVAHDQFVAVPEKLLTAKGKLPQADYRYLRVTTEISAENLPEFDALLDADLKAFTTRNEWYLGDTYLAITGREGAVSQVWIIPAKDDLNVADKLARASWLNPEVSPPPSFQILRATHSDPTIEGSGDLP